MALSALRAGLLLVLTGASVPSSAPPFDPPHVFDDSACADHAARMDAQGTDLQRSEVAGRYVLEESEFRRRYVETRLLSRHHRDPDFPELDFPDELQVKWADPEEAPALREQRENARKHFRAQSAEAYQRAGPVLVLDAQGRWWSTRADDGRPVGGGPYLGRGQEIVLVDLVGTDVPTRGPRLQALEPDPRGLRNTPHEWVRRHWPERADRLYARAEGAPAGPAPQRQDLPPIAPADVVGTWRVRPDSVAASIAGMKSTLADLQGIVEDAPAHRRLAPLRDLVTALGSPEAWATECWEFRPDGRFCVEQWSGAAWFTVGCGRWATCGPVVLVWEAAPGVEPHVRGLLLTAGRLTLRLSGPTDAAIYERISR